MMSIRSRPEMRDGCSAAQGREYGHFERVDDSTIRWVAGLPRETLLETALRRIVDAYTAWAEDHNDGTYAYYKSDDLMVACVEARKLLDESERSMK